MWGMQGLCLCPVVCVEGRGVSTLPLCEGEGLYGGGGGGQKQQQLGESRKDQKEERECR